MAHCLPYMSTLARSWLAQDAPIPETCLHTSLATHLLARSALRAGGAHLIETAFMAHLFADADGFCGQSRGWPAAGRPSVICLSFIVHLLTAMIGRAAGPSGPP